MASSETSVSAETKCIITGLLTSNPVRCTLKQLCNDFLSFVGYKIPIRQLGFASVEDYLRSIPDTIVVYGSGPSAEVEAVIKPKSAHINDMVIKQKKTSIPKHKKHKVRTYPRFQRSSYSGYPNPPSYNFNFAPNPPRCSFNFAISPASSCSSSPTNFDDPKSPDLNLGNHLPSPIAPTPPPTPSPAPTKVVQATCVQNDGKQGYAPQNRGEQSYVPQNIGEQSYALQNGGEQSYARQNGGEQSYAPQNGVEQGYAHQNGGEQGYARQNGGEQGYARDFNTSSVVLDDYDSNVPPRIQNNLRTLILQFPDGIWCTNLPTEYHKMFKKKLSYENYGYRSLIEMCADLPEIFQYVQPTSDDFVLYDKNKPIPPLDQNDIPRNHLPMQETIASTTIFEEVSLKWEMGPLLIPSDVLHPGDTICRYAVSSQVQQGDYLDVSIGEIYDISKFWLYLTFGELKPLMNRLQEFFRSHRNKYLIPELLLEEGLYCTCLYAGDFHRAVIVNLLPKLKGFVRVLFIDYGTVGNIRSNEIWYLPKEFSTVPCQAIRARLSNIYPPQENRPWSVQSINRFRELITNVPLVAEVENIDTEDNVLEIYLADITNEKKIFYINEVLVDEGHAVYSDQERTKTPVDPNCYPNVDYIHLYPEFFEIEAGNAPTTSEMNYIIEHKIPMHFYMPQYFKMSIKEDFKYIQEQHEKFNKEFPNLNFKPVTVKNDFDFSFFPDELLDEITDLVKREQTSSAKSKPNCDQIKIVPKIDNGEPKKNESVKEYFCNKKRISELIRGDTKTDSNYSGDVQVDYQSRASSVLSNSSGLHQETITSLNNLSLNNSGQSSVDNLTKSLRCTNPFLSEEYSNDINPFRSVSRNSTNPFMSDVEETINTSDLFHIFSKSSEEKLPEKIVNNLNTSPCPCKLTKQSNIDKCNSENLSSCGTAANPFKSPEKTTNEPRRVRTPPGFHSTNYQNAQFNPNNYNSYPNYNDFNFAYNPFYQRFAAPSFNNQYYAQNQFSCSMLQSNPARPPYYNNNYVPPVFPPQFQFNLQILQQALAAQNPRFPRPPVQNYGPYYNNQSGPRYNNSNHNQ